VRKLINYYCGTFCRLLISSISEEGEIHLGVRTTLETTFLFGYLSVSGVERKPIGTSQESQVRERRNTSEKEGEVSRGE
jgi:hypothetical protein